MFMNNRAAVTLSLGHAEHADWWAQAAYFATRAELASSAAAGWHGTVQRSIDGYAETYRTSLEPAPVPAPLHPRRTRAPPMTVPAKPNPLLEIGITILVPALVD